MFKNRKFYLMLAEWTSVIFLLPTTLIGGFLLGYYVVDPWLGTAPVFTIILLLLGIFAGFYQTFQIVKRKY